jgi:carboxyl-terminal processing protease
MKVMGKKEGTMSRRLQITLIVVFLISALALSFGLGYDAGRSPGSESLGIIEQAWSTIFSDYVERDKLDPVKLKQEAVRGMVEAIGDPYTAYLDPQNYRLSLSSLEGEIEGIGAQVGVREERITVIAAIPDSPADKAGVKAGDVILEISSESTEKLSLTEAVLKIRGPAGTPVRLLVQRQDEPQPRLIEIIRAKIDLVSVRLEMRDDIALIRMTHFSSRTDQELTPVIAGLAGQGAKGIILDLRSNPGGVLDVVVKVVSHFVREGVVASVVDNRGNKRDESIQKTEALTDLPVVVLVDNFSASGSEVLAGALQDYKRATIAGKTTFGKGSVNVIRQLEDGSGIYITTARWLTPNGRVIEGKGIEPDIQLEVDGEDAIKWAIDYLKGR